MISTKKSIIFILGCVLSITFQLNAQNFCQDIEGFSCDLCPIYTIYPNPNLEVSCGNTINAILLIDESNSIGNSNSEGDVEEAVNTFLQELECTDLNVAIIEFGSVANYIVQNYSPVSSIIPGMNDYFEGIPFNNQTYNPNQGIFGATNWQAAFLLSNALPPADILIMLTDGVPTAYTPDANLPASSFDFCGSGNSTQPAEIYNAVEVANIIKSEGTHVFIVGVGAVDASLIADISGPNELMEGGSVANTDFLIDTGIGDFVDSFSTLANNLCPLVDDISAFPACAGSSDGTISIKINENAQSPFFITVNNNTPLVYEDYIFDVTNLESGTYTIEVEGSGNCFGIGEYEIVIDTLPLPELIVQNINLCSEIKNQVDLSTLVTSTGNVSFHLSEVDAISGINQINPIIVNPTEATTYYVRSASLENVCFAIANINIDFYDQPTCIASDATIDCYSQNGTVQLLVESNSPNSTFSWSTDMGNIVSGSFSANPIVDMAGIYNVEVTNLETGCTNMCSVSVTENLSEPVIDFSPINALCFGHEPIELVAFPSGGEFTGVGVSGNIFQATSTGTTTIIYTYTDPSNGCSASESIDIQIVDCCEDETAFAYNTEYSTCFFDFPETSSNRWGWSNGPLSFGETYSFELIAGAGRCRISNGEWVGNVGIDYNEDGDMIIEYELFATEWPIEYELGTVHIYIGCDALPPSLAPGQMPYSGAANNSNTIEILIPAEDLDTFSCSEYYFIAHAEVTVCDLSTPDNFNLQIFEPLNSYTISVFPIPVREVLTVRYHFDYDTPVSFDITDLSGRILKSSKDWNYSKESKSEIKLKLPQFNQQLLFLRITTNKETVTKKLIVKQ